MKKITQIFLLLFLGACIAQGQNIIDEEFYDYKEQDNFTSVFISSKMFDLAQYIDMEEMDEDMEELKELMSSIKAFNMVFGENVEDVVTKYKDAESTVASSFEELMKIKDGDGNFSFYIDENKGMVYELVMVGHMRNELIIFSLVGEISLSKLSKIANVMQKAGIENIGKINTYSSDKLKIYPNPGRTSDDLTLEVPTEMLGANCTLINSSGQVMQDFIIKDAKQAFPTLHLNADTYILKIEYGDAVVSKKLIIQGK